MMNKEKVRLVQIFHPDLGRSVAKVEEPNLILLKGHQSIYELALKAIDTDVKLLTLIDSLLSEEKLNYDSVYNGESEWKLLPSFDCPDNPFACMVSGTGLTHHNSALNRQVMHQSAENTPTDSIKIYEWGLKGGKPNPGSIGVQPEWFYKGNGAVLKGHGESLTVPTFGNDGGEEPELAGVYIVDRNGKPRRIGLTTGNEFSDHIMEKKNYLYLAPSKIRECAIGPELVINADFNAYEGKVGIMRDGHLIWSSDIKTGEKNMSHSLENLEYHHFKYPSHRIPLQAHVHFFGADAFSFGNSLELQQDDEMHVEWFELGRKLKNKIQISRDKEQIVKAIPLL
ncbi:hypothetical protein KO566_03715 [Flavobacteriaceae bacterium XHP0103]|uniref:AraD1 family protein n=1 Tax=Marixanthotalea marina TaxID=2844359 RepID=UPI00298A0681|nr:AraD1 family protein [Marixanthotalea marina]MBU3821157.1 hypothetical protein [Marixanthotalea marina]